MRIAYRELSKHHARMLWVWLEWAQFELTYKKDFDKARELLLSEAAMHHKDSLTLKMEVQ